MLSCFGFRSRCGDADGEREPLLPRYNDDTALQARLHEKLHTYQMLRALAKGYMPSNEQTTVHLRSLLSADILNPDMPELSNSGRALVRSVKLWLTQFVEALQHKNADDQIQDFIWCLAKARLDVDTGDIVAKASSAKVKADTAATYRSLQTVGSLLLTNSDFRVFLSDLGTVGREVFRDTAFTLADVSKRTGQRLQPSENEVEALKGAEGTGQAVPSTQDLQDEAGEISRVVAKGAAEVASGAEESLVEHASGEERDALVHRLKQTVLNLRQKRDYSESASTLSLLLRRYLLAYSHVATEIADVAAEDASVNREADLALRNFWSLITSLGSRTEWNKVEESLTALVEDGRSDPEFDELVKKLAQLVQDMLMDPDFFSGAEERFGELRAKGKELATQSSVAEHVDELFSNLRAALQSVANDADITKLMQTTTHIAHILSPSNQYTNGELVQDSLNIFIPLLVQGVQRVPIPRLEVSTPAIDLLLENLILEPGRTVNNSSFLPYRLHITTQNDVDVRKARFNTTSSLRSLLAVRVSGLSVAADDLGYWLRLHSGLLRLADEGLAGFHLDERGLDIAFDVEIGRDQLEEMVTLRRVRVKIHHLNYDLSRSRFSCLAWLFKPLIRPIVRRALEIKIAAGVAEGVHMLNRELLFARERLRATRIADPDDLWTFVRAVAARLTPAPNPDIKARAGVLPGEGVFRGRYAPGSLVKLWETEGRGAEETVMEYERGGWRNGVFDVITMPA